MPAPSMQFENFLDPIKGWFGWNTLNYVAKKSATVTFDPLPAGRCVTINESGDFVTGHLGTQMPMFLFTPSDGLDVSNASGVTAKGYFVSQSVMPGGDMNALVAAGSYELSSTEYDTTRTYLRHDLLRGIRDNTTAALGGLLTNRNIADSAKNAPYVDPVCGVVSKHSTTNEYQIPTIEFWTTYLPVA